MSEFSEAVYTSHSSVGASSAKRWLNCPGSVRACEGLPSPDNDFSAEGTAAHELASRCLDDGSNPADHLGEFITVQYNDGTKDFEVTPDMASAVDAYVKYCRMLINKYPDAEYQMESLVMLSIDKAMFGTGDFKLISKEHRILHSVDYKHGAGVTVEVENNKQLRYYAIGQVESHLKEVDKVSMTIVQPRKPHPDGYIRTETVDVVDLLDDYMEFKAGLERTRDPKAPLVAGDWCQFCPAAPTCKALNDLAVETAKTEFSVIEAMPDNDLSILLDKLPVIENFCKQVREHAYQKASDGVVIPNYKLVKKQARRNFVDEQKVIEILEGIVDEDDYLAPRKLMSVAQIEKAIEKDEFTLLEPHISKQSSGNTLVHESDKRPAVSLKPEDDFSVIE